MRWLRTLRCQLVIGIALLAHAASGIQNDAYMVTPTHPIAPVPLRQVRHQARTRCSAQMFDSNRPLSLLLPPQLTKLTALSPQFKSVRLSTFSVHHTSLLTASHGLSIYLSQFNKIMLN
jgi:hypothetical protein